MVEQLPRLESPPPSSADFQVCCIAGFQTRRPSGRPTRKVVSTLLPLSSPADLEVGDTAGLETCATPADASCFRFWGGEPATAPARMDLMLSQSGQTDDDSLLAERCLHGDPAALAGLRERCHRLLTETLVSRGATRTEAEDLLAELLLEARDLGREGDLLLLGEEGDALEVEEGRGVFVARGAVAEDLHDESRRRCEEGGSHIGVR